MVLTEAEISVALQSLGLSAHVAPYSTSARLLTFQLTPKGTTVAMIRSRLEDLGVSLGVPEPRLLVREGELLLELQRPDPEFPLFRDVFVHCSGRLFLGVDSRNKPVAPPLSDLPHLLVAGATGSGKSVALHTMLCGLIASSCAYDLRLLLIDPKGIEFAPYGSLPHLVHPVVSCPYQAESLLEQVYQAMEKRYQALRSGHADYPPLVVVIDEYADLVGQNPGAAKLVKLLAQKARAAGIHLVLATQRPSAKVIDGDIKANFPSRLVLRVSSAVDSRVVLGQGGAETLLGKGDALFSNGTTIRLQVPLVSDETRSFLVKHYG